MATYKIIVGIGAILTMIGFLLLGSISVYDDSLARTVGELAVKLVVLAAGWWLINRGLQMRDER